MKNTDMSKKRAYIKSKKMIQKTGIHTIRKKKLYNYDIPDRDQIKIYNATKKGNLQNES